MSKLVSVIIPTLNEEKFIATLLTCLNNQTWQNFEIIVADAKSEDKTREIAQKAGAKIVEGGHQAFGRNNGVKHAKGDILLFLDADVSFDTNFLGNCYQSFVTNKLDIACCYFDTYPLSLKMKMIYGVWNSSKYLRRKTKSPDGESQCLWVKKSVFQDVGGFNEGLKIAEDIDFIQRAIEKDCNFDILNYKFTPSDRRYKKVGIWRVFAGSLIGGIMQILGIFNQNSLSQNIYGNWGKFND
jgi:glycosyltransferase involved in cell wall biosynthesis